MVAAPTLQLHWVASLELDATALAVVTLDEYLPAVSLQVQIYN